MQNILRLGRDISCPRPLTETAMHRRATTLRMGHRKNSPPTPIEPRYAPSFRDHADRHPLHREHLQATGLPLAAHHPKLGRHSKARELIMLDVAALHALAEVEDRFRRNWKITPTLPSCNSWYQILELIQIACGRPGQTHCTDSRDMLTRPILICGRRP